MTIENLKLVLSRVPVGKLPPSMTRELFELVTASWHEFSGSHEASMKAWKINRDKGPEDVTWNPPCLSFVVVRHGGAVLGSKRAERQQWTLNLEMRTADHLQVGYLQLRPNAPKLDVKGLADEVCRAVQEGPTSASPLVSAEIIVWKNNDELTIYHGKMVSGAKRTRSDRRRRLIDDLKPKMALIGWTPIPPIHRGLTFRKIK
jgi:hypothetical protein